MDLDDGDYCGGNRRSGRNGMVSEKMQKKEEGMADRR